MTIRGSDAISYENWNDWVDNDAQFALNHIHTPQAKLATVGMKAKIAEMREKAPNATMDITGHSLGTIVSAQGVAGLTDQELEKIGEVVLFDGPDTTKSLKKMGLTMRKSKRLAKKSSTMSILLMSWGCLIVSIPLPNYLGTPMSHLRNPSVKSMSLSPSLYPDY